MISRSFLILYTFSVLYCMILWLGGVYEHTPELATYSMFYGIILPIVYALLTFVKFLRCKSGFNIIIDNKYSLCPVTVGEGSLIPAMILSYSSSVVSVIALAFLFGVKITVSTPSQIMELTPLTVLMVFLMQIPVGTMEEGVFRQAIPEALALLGGYPLYYAFLSSILFGVLHLWAYQSVFLTISATVVGIINSLIYYGYTGVKAGSLGGIALGHTLYNTTIIRTTHGTTVLPLNRLHNHLDNRLTIPY